MSTDGLPLRRKARKRSVCRCGRLILTHDWIYRLPGEQRWICWLCAFKAARADREWLGDVLTGRQS